MGVLSRNRRWVVVSLLVSASLIGPLLYVGKLVHADQSAPPTIKTIKLGTARPDSLYAFTLGVKDLAQLQAKDAVRVTVNDAQGEIESKWLHEADGDFYLTLRPRAAGPVTVSLSASAALKIPSISAAMTKIPEGA